MAERGECRETRWYTHTPEPFGAELSEREAEDELLRLYEGAVERHLLSDVPVGLLLSGAVLTETVFGLAGVGKTITDAIDARDYVVIQGFTLVIAIVFLTVNLIVDVSYAWLDPRIRLS